MSIVISILCHKCLKFFPSNMICEFELQLQDMHSNEYFGCQIYQLCYDCRDTVQKLINERLIFK